LNNTLSGLVELVAYALIILTMDKLGRKVLLAASLLFGGVTLLISTVIKQYQGDNQGYLFVEVTK